MIGGNITAVIQTAEVSKNAIGEQVKTWADKHTLKGWLDLSGGDSRYTSYHAKIQESTHIFICDYTPLDVDENSRMVINNKVYDILLIDNPMELNEQLEIFLKYTGGQ